MNIYTKTVLDALARPSTLKALVRKTEYPAGRILQSIVEARGEGYGVRAVMRKEEPTYYERIEDEDDATEGR